MFFFDIMVSDSLVSSNTGILRSSHTLLDEQIAFSERQSLILRYKHVIPTLIIKIRVYTSVTLVAF